MYTVALTYGQDIQTLDDVFACVCCYSTWLLVHASYPVMQPHTQVTSVHTCGWSFFAKFSSLRGRDQEIQDETRDEIKDCTWDLELEWLTMNQWITAINGSLWISMNYESLWTTMNSWITSNSSDSFVMSSHFRASGPISHTSDVPGNHGDLRPFRGRDTCSALSLCEEL